MSSQIALDTINLKAVPRLAHTEYSWGYHRQYIEERTGLQFESPNCMAAFADQWGLDFYWTVNDGLYGDWSAHGRATDMGHAAYAADGGDMAAAQSCPFSTPEEVWAFDAVDEYGLPEFDDQVDAYEKHLNGRRDQYPGQLIPGGYYKTIVSGALEAFGWDMLLTAAADPQKMERVWDSFYQRALFHMKAWAQTSAEVIIQHDDFVWTSGPFMRPEIYRDVIIPRYTELWKPLHEAGKKVLFCADGDFTQFASDIVAGGADGLIFEPCMDFGYMVDHFGQETVLVGSYVDCRDMAFNGWDTVKAAMDQTFARAGDCRGLIVAVGNHIPANIPEDILDRYISYLQENW